MHSRALLYSSTIEVLGIWENMDLNPYCDLVESCLITTSSNVLNKDNNSTMPCHLPQAKLMYG